MKENRRGRKETLRSYFCDTHYIHSLHSLQYMLLPSCTGTGTGSGTGTGTGTGTGSGTGTGTGSGTGTGTGSGTGTDTGNTGTGTGTGSGTGTDQYIKPVYCNNLYIGYILVIGHKYRLDEWSWSRLVGFSSPC